MIPIKQPCFRNGPKAYYDLSTVKWMRNKVKPEEISKSINSLLIRKENDEGILIKLIKKYSLMKSNSLNDILDINGNKNRRNSDKILGYDPALFFQKDSLDKIYKLRNLFSSYDIAQERKLNLNKVNSILNVDKGTTQSQRELKQLFANIQSVPSSLGSVNKKSKQPVHHISLNDLVEFSFNQECTKKYLNIMKELKDTGDTERSKYLPLDFERALLYYHDHSTSMRSINRMKGEIGKIDMAYDNGKGQHENNNISFYTTSRQLKRVLDLTKKHIDSIEELPLIKQNINIINRSKGNLLKRYNKIMKRNSRNESNNTIIHINNESNAEINDNIDEGKLPKSTHFIRTPNTNINTNTIMHNQVKFRNKIKGHKSKSMNSTDWSASII